MELTGFEKKSIINWNEEEREASIYTASPKVARRLIKGGLKPDRQEGSGWLFKVPKQQIRVKVGNRAINLAGILRKRSKV